MKMLLVTFSDNADHQDTTFGMYEELVRDGEWNAYLLAIKNPKVKLEVSSHTWLVDCPKRPGICKGTFNLPLLLNLIRKIKRYNFDAIYFESLHVWNLPIMWALRGKTRIYHVIHDVIPHKGDRASKKVDFFNKVLVKLADVIILRNKKYISSLINHYQVPSHKVKYLELWRRYPDYTSPTYSKKCLFFGRINPYKGIDNLLAIVKKCPNVLFEVVGKVDPTVKNIVAQLKSEPNVHLETGYVSDKKMRQYFVQSDWVLIPYESASQSGVIIDAYKYSRPVIAFNVGAISEQVEDRKTGFLIPSGDNDAFSSCINKVMYLPKNYVEEYSKRAYAFGSKKYAANGKVSKFKNLIKENIEIMNMGDR